MTKEDFHSISYTLSRNQIVVVQYAHDEDSDMFQVRFDKSYWGKKVFNHSLQIGRSSENQIDCIVMDTVPGAKTFNDLTVSQSTISRYACRIVVSRHPPYTARIYAAGFDSSKNIFLGVRNRSPCSLFHLLICRSCSTGKIDQMEN